MDDKLFEKLYAEFFSRGAEISMGIEILDMHFNKDMELLKEKYKESNLSLAFLKGFEHGMGKRQEKVKAKIVEDRVNELKAISEKKKSNEKDLGR